MEGHNTLKIESQETLNIFGGLEYLFYLELNLKNICTDLIQSLHLGCPSIPTGK